VLADFRDADGTEVPADVYYDALTHTHQRRVRVRVMDLDHGRIAWLPDLLDGQMTIDTSNREVSRVANVTLFDPAQSIGWEPNTPAALPGHLRQMIQILDERAIPGYGWVSCPVFTGPISEFDRSGSEVRLAAEGKDRLALSSFGRSHVWKKGRKVTTVIREILELGGEKPTRIHLPELANTLARDFNVSRTDRPLVEARKLARSLNDRIIFYDGRGHAVMRVKSTTAVGPRLDEDWLMGPVRIDRRKLEFRNGWIINGPRPGGNKPRPTSGLVGLPKNNDFSAYSLRRNGKWRWLIHEEEQANVKTNAKAHEIAARMRDERIKFAADVGVDILPLPNIEEFDYLRAVDPLTGAVLVRVLQATIPLVGGAQTIGAVNRITRKTNRRR
jgi:hypothetical protein